MVKRRPPPPSGLERYFLLLAVWLGSLAWTALLLAELGWLSAPTLAGASVVACLGAAAWSSRSPAPSGPGLRAAGPDAQPRDTRTGTMTTAAGVTLALVVAVLFFPAYETTLWAGDATVYRAFAAALGDAGGLVFEDSLLQALPDPLQREFFRNATPGDTTGVWARFPGGFLIPDISEPRVTAGFSPLFPVLLAVSGILGGHTGMSLVSPLFAALAVCGAFLVGRRLRDARAGLLAAALLAVSLPQVWYARFSTPEVVAELFVLAGVLALLNAGGREGARVPVVGGALLGLAVLAKVDLAVLATAALVLLAAGVLLVEGRWARDLGRFLAGFSVILVHLAIHYAFFPTHYGDYVSRRVRMSFLSRAMAEVGPWVWAGLGAGALAAGVLWLLAARLRHGHRVAGTMLLAAVAAYLANYFLSTEPAGITPARWLGAYVSWPLVGLAVLGGARSLRRSGAWWRAGLLAVLASVVCVHWLYAPHVVGSEPLWSFRRFVPVVLPAAAILGGSAAVGLADRLPASVGRWALAGIVGGLLFLTASPTATLLGIRPWSGVAEGMRDLASRFRENPVVLVSPELTGTHLATSLTYLHGVDAVLVQARHRHTDHLSALISHLRASGRTVYLLFGGQGFGFYAPELVLRRELRHELAVVVAESEAPGGGTVRSEERRLRLTAYRCASRPPARRFSIDVGDPRDDLVFRPLGLHAPERADGGRTFRWTGARASLQLPSFTTLRMMVAGPRPGGLSGASLSVAIDGEAIVHGVSIGASPTELVVANPRPDAPGPIELELAADTFVPRRQGISSDSRELGVVLYGIELEVGRSTGAPGRRPSAVRGLPSP